MSRGKKCIAVGEMFLLVSFSFAIAFLMSGYVGVVGALPAGYPTSPVRDYGQGSFPADYRGYGFNEQGEYGLLQGRTPPEINFEPAPPAIPAPATQQLLQSNVDTGQLINARTGLPIESSASVGSTVDVGGVNYVVQGDGTMVAEGFKAGAAGGAAGAGTSSSLYKSTFLGITTEGATAYLLDGLWWSAVVIGVIQLAGSLLGLDKELTSSLSYAAGAGIMSYELVNAMGPKAWNVWTAAPTWAPWIGIGVAVAVFLYTYEKEKKEMVQFECLQWEAPLGGQNCERCNEDSSMPCSEYRCKSLGQGCEIVNKGTAEEKCFWMNKNDVTAPVITPWEDALMPEELKYVRDGTGVKIIDARNPNGCINPYSAFTFGVQANEPAKCRVSFTRTEKFEDMQYPFANSQLFRMEHKQQLSIPDPADAEEAVISGIHNNGRYNLYVRCIDGNGNGKDSAETPFNFCVAQGPDETPPEIRGTSIPSGSPVMFNADNVDIEVYVNEPAECKWSKSDKDYDAMENTMNCATRPHQINDDLNYVCSGKLTGIINRQDNSFYFRCKDHPRKVENERNEMRQSYPLVLKGTEELVIDKVGPSNVTIQGSTTYVMINLTVQTSHGAEEGKAVCGYSTNKDDISTFINMDVTNDYLHNQPIQLQGGQHTFYFRCTDRGGNTVVANTTFTIEVDITPPEVARVFKDGSSLKIITTEEAMCAYSTTNCNYNFEDGKPLSWVGGNKMMHLSDWNPEVTYYIKCRDMQGNEPSPNACQVIAQGSEF